MKKKLYFKINIAKIQSESFFIAKVNDEKKFPLAIATRLMKINFVIKTTI